jgi:5'-nucleotidase
MSGKAPAFSQADLRKLIGAVYRPRPPSAGPGNRSGRRSQQRAVESPRVWIQTDEGTPEDKALSTTSSKGLLSREGSVRSTHGRPRSATGVKRRSWGTVLHGKEEHPAPASNKPFHPNPWILVRVYIRIKTFLTRYLKAHRVENNEGSVKGIAARVASGTDSNNWKHIFLIGGYAIDEEEEYLAAKLYLSSSHIYLHTNDISHSIMIRLVDIIDIGPADGGLSVTYTLVTNSLMEAEEVDEKKKHTLFIETDEAATIAMHFHEEKSSMLLKYIQAFTTNIKAADLTRRLTIVHFNDTYHLPPFKPPGSKGIIGGVSRFHTVLSQLRETENPLVLFSGDFMGPSLMSVITKGKQMIDAMNFLGVHYGCFGNHEFDFGLKCLKEQIHGYTQGKHVHPGSQTKWIMTNMTEGDGKTPLGGVQKTALFRWNGIQVGILGLCENWLPQCAYLSPQEAKYFDIFEVGEEEARKLKANGAEVVLALTHCRHAVDRLVTERCPSIDYLLGGHDHFYKSDPKHRIVKSGQEFEYLSKIFVDVRRGEAPKFKVQCEPITNDIQESDHFTSLILRYEAKMAEKLGKPIGRSEFPMDSTEETVRFKEGLLTNFLLDIMEIESGADFAVLGAAAIAGKEVKEEGFISLGDVFNWFPNETRIMKMRLQGNTIQKMLDVMVREVPAEAPSFPHPSASLSFTINLVHKPTPVVEDITIKGEPLRPLDWYTVSVEEFVGLGRAKYKMVGTEGEVIVNSENAPQLVNWVLEFFQKQKSKQDTQMSLQETRIKSVVKVVSSATHLGVDMDMVKSQKFIRSLICELLRCDRSAVFLVDNTTDELHFFPDGAKQEVRFKKSIGLAGAVATEKEPLLIKDVYDDSRFNRAIDNATGYRTKSMLACPVIIDGFNCTAVVQAINKDPALNEGYFDESDKVVLTFLGEQVGYQLRNAEIYTRVQKSGIPLTDEIRTVLKMAASDVFTESEAALKSLTKKAADLISSETVRFVRRKHLEDELFCYLEENVEETFIADVPVESGTGLHKVITTGQSLILEDPTTAATAMSREINVGALWKNVLMCPVISPGGIVVGVVMWINATAGKFTNYDGALGEYFALICGATIQNLIRIESLDLDNANSVPTVTAPTLGRIKVKGGWHTVRQLVRSHQVATLRARAGEGGIQLWDVVPPELGITDAVSINPIGALDGSLMAATVTPQPASASQQNASWKSTMVSAAKKQSLYSKLMKKVKGSNQSGGNIQGGPPNFMQSVSVSPNQGGAFMQSITALANASSSVEQ